MEPSGQNLKRLTPEDANYRSPHFSPDGRYMAYIRCCAPQGAVLLYDRELEAQETVIEGQGEYGGLVWSTDGSLLAFVHSLGGQTALMLYTRASRQISKVLTWDGDLGSPTWSPDSRQLAFAAQSTHEHDETPAPYRINTEIYRVGVDGRDVTQLTWTEGNARGPAWSPVNSSIAFVEQHWREPPYHSDLMILDPSDAEHPQRTLAGNAETRPVWSSDGTEIAISGLVGDVRIVSMDDGAEVTVVPASPASTIPYGWSGDARMLLVDARCCGPQFVYVVMLSDLKFYPPLGLHHPLAWQTNPTWVPGSDLIAFAGLEDPPIP